MKRTIDAVLDMAHLIGTLGRFLWARKLWWLAPIVLVLLLVLVLVALAETPLAPFIYTLF